jgi:hypothetical protein
VTVTVELPACGIVVVSEYVRVRLTVWRTTEVWPGNSEVDPVEEPCPDPLEPTRTAPTVMLTITNARATLMTLEDGNISKDGISDLVIPCWPGNSFCNKRIGDNWC